MRHLWMVLLTSSLCWVNSAVATDKSFIITTEPWAGFVGAQLPDNGWTMAVARAVLEPQGYSVSLKLVPWARAVRCSKSGKCDGLYLAYYTQERTQWYVFSDPVGEVRTGFYKLKSRDISFTTLEDLRPYKIGMTRGVAISPEFDSANYLHKEEVMHDSLNVKKLLKGRVDLVAAPEQVFRNLIVTTLPQDQHDKFEFMTPYLSVQKLHMAISKNSSDYQQKLQDFNRGLKQIMADGTYHKILRSYGY